MGDAKQFAVSLKKFGASQQKTLSKLVRRAAFTVMGDLVKGSPVDTGRFKSSWFVGVGQPNRDVEPDRVGGKSRASTFGKKTGGEASLRRLSELTPETVTGTEPVIISNNLPYGPALANGHSGQAPSGWVDAAVQRAGREINVVEVKP